MSNENHKEELLRNKQAANKQKQQFADYVRNQQEGKPGNRDNQEMADSQRIADDQNRMKDTENLKR